MTFESYLLESKAADQAHKEGLIAAGYGLWRNKAGKIVKKTVDDKLVDVRGSEANIRHYSSVIPSKMVANHSQHDQSSDIVSRFETQGTHRESDVTKHSIIEFSAVSKEKAPDLHEALVQSGYKYSETPFGHMYRNDKTSIMVSNHPEVSHKRGGEKKDHFSIVIKTDHNSKNKK